ALAALLLTDLVIPRPRPWAWLMSLVRALVTAIRPLLGVGVFVAIEILSGQIVLSPLATAWLALVTSAGALTARALPLPARRRAPRRVAVIGSAAAAEQLARDLAAAGVSDYRVAGRIAVADSGEDDRLNVATLGSLRELGELAARHRIRLLVIASDAPRYAVLEEASHSCLGLPVSLVDLSELYERVFALVPLSAINAAWFQGLLARGVPTRCRAAKRTVDILVAALAGLVLAPIALLAALLVRRDGGPALFRQTRVGEGGREFTILKLRTMRVGANSAWAAADDERVTRLGRLLRRSHIDEIPQLLNVLKGDMSLVGPRPEQPAYVRQLERLIPFYSRRLVMKPGITGWAQVRCGYAGSELGTAWKVAHDLYYLKNRSFAFDLAILAQTLRLFLPHGDVGQEPEPTPFVTPPASLIAREARAVASLTVHDGHA
ncbi:MAG: exopolysaccharide biosynthesis polyprenyl glycosylphosphotransferase, partial [Solirubrobacteraceae bacterium]